VKPEWATARIWAETMDAFQRLMQAARDKEKSICQYQRIAFRLMKPEKETPREVWYLDMIPVSRRKL